MLLFGYEFDIKYSVLSYAQLRRMTGLSMEALYVTFLDRYFTLIFPCSSSLSSYHSLNNHLRENKRIVSVKERRSLRVHCAPIQETLA